ncbi:MAG: hypothetical protein IKF39_01645 [Oscillospiraceae bacterium]|nr:hypothetical protein [Oscillospiraceae bacterium]
MALKITELELGIRDNASQAARGIDRLTRSLTKLKAVSANSDIGKIAEQLGEIQRPSGNGGGIGRVGDQIADIAPKAKKSASALGNLWSSIKRIAMYRAIRSAMKLITQSITEGIQNLYQYSSLVGTEFAPAMDKLATSALYLKNSLGAMVSPIIEFLTPYVDLLVDKFVGLLNIVNQVFSALAGKTTYTRAIKQTTKFAEATDSASKAMKKMLFGFDELNILSDPNSGAAKEMKDFATMFETVDIDNPIAKMFGGVGTWIKSTISGIDFEDGSGLTTSDVLNGIMGSMIAFGTTALGWELGGIGGAAIGLIVGVSLSSILTDVDWDKGSVTVQKIITSLRDVLPAVAGGFLGWTLGGPQGAAIGAVVGASAALGLVDLGFWDESVSESDSLRSLAAIMTAAMGGYIGFKAYGLAGAAVGATLGASLGLGLTSAKFKKSKDLKDLMNETLKNAMWAAGGYAIGFMLTGPVGGLMGATLMLSLKIGLEKVDFQPINDIGNKLSDAFEGTFLEYWLHGEGGQSGAGTGSSIITPKTRKASGGSVPRGAMFIAGEAGAEIVSNIGGGTQVSNIDQLSAANNNVVEAVYAIGNAIVGAINSQDYGTYIDGEKLTRTINSKMKALNHYNGESLVQGAY